MYVVNCGLCFNTSCCHSGKMFQRSPHVRLLCVREAQAVRRVLFRERGRRRRRGLRQCTLHPGARERRPRTEERPRGNGPPEFWGIEHPLILNGAGVTPDHGNDIHDTTLTFVQYCHTMSRLTYVATELQAILVREYTAKRRHLARYLLLL